ncbi:hypothetical protein L249_7094, partial [Ophiocordyceps polyrhachis-furcata BCC 54312]
EQHNNVGGGYGYGYGTATPYSGYGRTGRTGRELTANSTLFFFDLCGRYGYGYGKRPLFRPFLPSLFFLRPALRPTETTGTGGIRVRAKSSSYNSRHDSRYNRNNSSIRTYLRPYREFSSSSINSRKRSRNRAKESTGYLSSCPPLPTIKDTIDWLEKHAFFCRKIGSGPGPGPGPGPNESTEHSYSLFQALPKEIQGLGGSRDAGPAVAGPRPPYVTEAVRHSGCGYGYGYGTATPYSGYGRTGRTKEGT